MLTNRPSRLTLIILSLIVPLFVYFGYDFAFDQTLVAQPYSVDANGRSVGKETPAIKQIPVPRPPMGWSSWNSFSNIVDSAVIMQQAKALVESGAQRAGYEYVNID